MNGLGEAVLLVGGRGTRLQSLVDKVPKPMLEVAGRPFIEWILLALRIQGIRTVVMCISYLAEVIQQHLRDGSHLGIDIAYSYESTPLGTAGAIRMALDQVRSDCFLILNGDSYCKFDVENLYRLHMLRKATATLWLVESSDTGRFGTVEINKEGTVLTYHEKSSKSRVGLVNAGVYLVERSMIEVIPAGKPVSLETEVFPGLVGHGLSAVVGQGPLVDIGTPEAYQDANIALRDELRMLNHLEM